MNKPSSTIRKRKQIINSRGSNKLKPDRFSRYFEECTGHSKLHGVRFLGERNRTLSERIVWLVIIAVCILTCAYFTNEAYQKRRQSPMVVKIGQKQISVDRIAFPAVTVCPAVKITREMIELIGEIDGKSDVGGAPSQGELLIDKLKRFKYLQMWCPHANFKLFNASFNLNESYGLDALNFIYNNTPSIYETLLTCLWNDVPFDCFELFTPTFTEDGVCYTFNSLDRSQLFNGIVLDYKHFNRGRRTSCYDDLNPSCSDRYPFRSNSAGKNGLTVYFNDRDGKENPCSNSWNGHKVIVHKPNELAILKETYYSIPLSKSRILTISPQIILTDEALRDYPPEQRKCYFDGERRLAHFRYYTENNCRTECLFFNASYPEKCSEFYKPHISPNETICNATSTYNIKKWREYLKSKVGSATVLNAMEVPLESQQICTCYPQCQSLSFDVTYLTPTEELAEGVSKLQVYFKDSDIIPYERNLMFATMDLIVYCASLFSVFTGFSFIVLFEIFYFVCLRPLCNIFIGNRKIGDKLANGCVRD